MCLLQTGGEVRGGGTADEVVVGIMPERQLDNIGACAGALQVLRKLVSGALPGLVFILIKNDVDQTRGPIAELLDLTWRQVCAEGAGRIAKASLPKHGQVE